MNGRGWARLILSTWFVLGAATETVLGVDVHVSGNVNLSALGLSANDTNLIFDGAFTLTVDTTNSFKISGINADGNSAVIAFTGTNKLRLANSAGNVVIQEGFGGDISVTGTNAAAGFSTTLETGEIVEVRATVDDAAASNNWMIGNNTLWFAASGAQVGTVQIGSDGGVAMIDVDQTTPITGITPSGDFSISLAAGQTLTVTNALTVGDNTLTLIGGGSTSVMTATGGVNLSNSTSKVRVTGTMLLSNLDVAASGTLELGDGIGLTLTDAVAIGANTLTVTGTAGGGAETITATNGFTLNNADSVLKINGDSAHAMVISKVDITGADLNAGKGIDADESVDITALTVSQNATVDVASSKTLGGTTTLNTAKTLTLNNSGTVSSVTAMTAAGTVQLTGTGTIATLTNNVAGTTVDVNESSTISTFTMTENAMFDVATGKVLTSTVTVPAGKIMTTREAGTVSHVVLNGAAAELNVTAAAGIVSTLEVNVDGGILDVDNACTVTNGVMKQGSGDLTVQNANVRITSTGGFDLNNNELSITEANGTLDLVTGAVDGGEIDVDENSTITALNANADVDVDVANTKTLTATATVSSTHVLETKGTGTISNVTLNGAAAELNMTAVGTVSVVNVNANAGVVDIDSSGTLSLVSMAAGVGDLTLEVSSGQVLSGTIDVNDNVLTLSDTGVPGMIQMDMDGGTLNLDANATPTTLTISGDVTIDVASSKTLTASVTINDNTLTLPGSGTVSRVNATTGTILANGSGTISDLRVTFGSGGTFTYGGTGSSTISTLANSTVGANETFRKTGSGSVVLDGGVNSLFSAANGVRVQIDEGEVVVGRAGTNDNITFNDDGDEITVASGATLTTFGSFTVSAAGTNVNLDAAAGSTVNLRSSSGAETIDAAADNDFQFLGVLNLDGTNGDYTLGGAFVFQFGDVEINTTGSLINNTPNSSMLFMPDSRISLSGTTGGTLIIDGQAEGTMIMLATTTGDGTFTLSRNGSENVTVNHAMVSNSIYTSSDGGAGVDELMLTGVMDGGDNVNWFSAADVPDEDMDDDESVDDEPIDDDGETDESADDSMDDSNVDTTVGPVATVNSTGFASAGAASDSTGAAGLVEVEGATSGSVFVTIADGNLEANFDGIPNEAALPVTMRVTGSVTGEMIAVVQLCYPAEMLASSGLSEPNLVLYVFDEDSNVWVLAGVAGQYQGDQAPTDMVGDYGIDSANGCVWAIRDSFSVFAVGDGNTEVSEGDGDSGPTAAPTGVGLCGVFGFVTMGLIGAGLLGLRFGPNGRRNYSAPAS